MDAQQFLAEFGHIANAPGGVARLKELVIQLAISGRLVEKIATEGRVSDDINEASAMRKEYEAKLELRATQSHSGIGNDPFAIPSHWQWARLDQLTTYIQRGKGPKYVERSATRVVSQKCVQWSGFDLTPARFVSEDTKGSYGKERYLCAGDLLWNSTGTGTAGRIAIFEGDEGLKAVADSHVTVIRLANFSPRYLWCVIASPWVQARIDPTHTASLVSGTTQQVELSTSTARVLPIPCPPTEEQSRIVAKVDELMALCDQLEAQQQQRRSLQNKLRQSTLQTVAAATSPHELQTTWTRLADNFGQLFDAPEDVDDLRKTVCELAIRGELDAVRLHEEDSNVEGFLAELAQGKSAKRFAKLDKVDEEFSLPQGWHWVLLEDLLADSESGWSPKCDSEPRRTGEWGVLKVSAVTWGEFDPGENKRLPLALEPRIDFEVQPGDFLLSRANTADLVARSVIAPTDCPAKLMMSDKIIRLKFLDERVKPWANLVNNSEFARHYYKARATGTSDSMRNVSRQVIHELPIPFPSLPAQQRVMDKLARLLQFCDELEAKLASRIKVGRRFAATATAGIGGISNTPGEDAPLKAPQTELIAPLRLDKTPDIKSQAPLATILARYQGELAAKDLWQRFGGEIDAFYAQLKQEVAHGWIQQPEMAEMREKASA